MEDEDVVLQSELHHRNLPSRDVLLHIEPDELVLILLEPIGVHVEDASHRCAFIGVDGFNPLGVVHEVAPIQGRPLAIVIALEVIDERQVGVLGSHGGRGGRGDETDERETRREY
jgi:hypothetical protein